MLKSIILVFSFFCRVSSIELPEQNSQEIGLVNFAKKVYMEECTKCRTTMIFYTEEDMLCNKFLQDISKEEKPMSLIILSLTEYLLENENFLLKENVDLIIFFLDSNWNNITVLEFQLEEWKDWNIRAKHLFVVSGILYNHPNRIHFFTFCFRHNRRHV